MASLPTLLRPPRFSARTWALAAASVGAGVAGFSGLYPQFDGGRLRPVLALTAAFFAPAILAATGRLSSRAKAIGATFALAALLGVVAAVVPAAILTFGDRHGDMFLVAMMFGLALGAPCGLLYAIPIAVLGGVVHPHTKTDARLDGADRVARFAGAWLALVSLFACAVTITFDASKLTYLYYAPTLLEVFYVVSPAVVAALAGIAGLVVGVRAHLRLRAARCFVARASAGREPGYRVRDAGASEDLSSLPACGPGSRVLEWCPSDAREDGAYRSAAAGVAVARF